MPQQPFAYQAPTPDRRACTKEALKAAILEKLTYSVGKDPLVARPHDWLKATILAVRDRVIDEWMESSRESWRESEKRVYYLSLEFLIGRLLRDAMSNIGLLEPVREALAEFNVELGELITLEPDAALGNGGQVIQPTFVKGQRNEAQQVVDPDVAREVVRMMETVVTNGGAKQAAILGYHVAGKTGTARKNGPRGYERGHYNLLFAGVVPATAPRFAAVIVVNDPRGAKQYGGLVSAPVFHHVMEGTLRLMDVPPDDIQSWLAAQAAGKVGGNPATHPAVLPVADAADAANPEAEFAAAIPAAPAEVRQ